jgi:predicted amidophosphoribosyltransferase
MKEQLAEKKGMKKCPACQASMAQDAQFCPNCGAKYETPYEEE